MVLQPFNDMYFFPDSTAEATVKMGMRGNLGLVVLEFPTNYANDADSYIQKGLEARDHWRDEALIGFSLAPHAPYTVSDTTFERIMTLADQVGIGVHTHMHETLHEIADSEQQYGLRPLNRFANLGVLSPNLTLAHCVHLNDAEIKLLAAHGCSIAHCPSSNLKLASGIAPITEYMKTGHQYWIRYRWRCKQQSIRYVLPKCDLLPYSQKARVMMRHLFLPIKPLKWARLKVPKALGMDAKIGSIEVGKLADLCAVKLSDIETQPCFDPVSHLIYAAGREQVSHVWVAGDLKFHRPMGQGIYHGV